LRVSQSAYIYFVEGSAVEQLSLDGVKEQLQRYREQTALTGRQLGWDYADAAFPYTIEQKADEPWFYLKGKESRYRHIVFGVGETERDGRTVHYVQVVLPDYATYGDKGKANELCKYIAKHLQAELKLFNGRTIYYNPRK